MQAHGRHREGERGGPAAAGHSTAFWMCRLALGAVPRPAGTGDTKPALGAQNAAPAWQPEGGGLVLLHRKLFITVSSDGRSFPRFGPARVAPRPQHACVCAAQASGDVGAGRQGRGAGHGGLKGFTGLCGDGGAGAAPLSRLH